MPTDSSGFVAGYYTASYNGADLGMTEAGFEMEPDFNYEEIKSDQFGDTIIDGICGGINLRLRFSLIEWTTAGRQACQWNFGIAASETGDYTVQNIGQTLIGGGFAKSLLLTPVAGINSNLKAYNFPLCIPSKSGHGGFKFSSAHRKIAGSLLVLPNRTVSPAKMFTVS